MASDDTPENAKRDRLDALLTRAARAAKRPRGVPAPGRDEPSDDELLRVVEGTATPAERQRVESAARASAFTRDRLEILRESLAETGLGPSPLTRAARYVFVMGREALELLRAATEPVALPQAVAVRGTSSEPVRSYYEFVQPLPDPGVEAHLKIEHVTRSAGPASIDVQVKLVGGAGARVSLLKAGTAIDSMPVDADGAATFTGLGRDRYEIVVTRAGQEQGRVSLEFRGDA
jgi:hypothetical protein